MTQQQGLLPVNVTPKRARPPCSRRGPRPHRPAADPPVPGQQRLRQHPGQLPLGVENLRAVGPGPGSAGHTGVAGPGGSLSLPPGRGAAPLGGHRPAPPIRHRRDPQDQRPPGPHGQRGSPESDEGHRPRPRTGREAGKTPYRRGPGGHKSHSVIQTPLGDGKKQESAERASWRARVGLALLSVLRDGLLRRSEAAALTWGDVEIRDNSTALINVRRS